MMTKLQLSAHWTAEEAETILSFIDELREVVLVGYEAEIRATHLLGDEWHL